MGTRSTVKSQRISRALLIQGTKNVPGVAESLAGVDWEVEVVKLVGLSNLVDFPFN
jgi:hypothetical protein